MVPPYLAAGSEARNFAGIALTPGHIRLLGMAPCRWAIQIERVQFLPLCSALGQLLFLLLLLPRLDSFTRRLLTFELQIVFPTDVLQMADRRAGPSWETWQGSRSDTEEALNEGHLSDNVAFCQPSDLTFSDHVHRLVSFNCV